MTIRQKTKSKRTSSAKQVFPLGISKDVNLDEQGLLNKSRDEAKTKYGDKENDCISTGYKQSKEIGDWYCTLNIKKYTERYSRPNSSKSNNVVDLIKAKDYLERMIEQHKTSK
jgi:hypothetical protein